MLLQLLIQDGRSIFRFVEKVVNNENSSYLCTPYVV